VKPTTKKDKNLLATKRFNENDSDESDNETMKVLNEQIT